MRYTEMEVCAGAVRADCSSEGGGKEKKRRKEREKKKKKGKRGRRKKERKDVCIDVEWRGWQMAV
jgi:hypothetical protein